MKVRLILVLFVCLQGGVVSAAEEDARLRTFFQQFLEAEFQARPVFATMMGDHRFDDRLDDISPKARAATKLRYQQTLADLPKKVPYEKLSRNAQIDYEILEHHLRRELWFIENTDPYANDPRTYNQYISDSIYILLTQSTVDKRKAIANAASRIRKIPQIIEAAKVSLKNPPKILTEVAIRQNKGSIGFYESGIYTVLGETPQVSSLKPTADKAVAVLKEYQTFLEKEVLPRSNGEWRLGKEKFAAKLLLELNAGYTADQVLADAEREFTRVENEMYIIAKQLWGQLFPKKTLPPDDEEGRRTVIREVLAVLSKKHGQADNLVKDARSTVARIKALIEKQDILRLPKPDRCQIVEMPEFQRGFSVAYLNPAPPLDSKSASIYAISPPPSDWDTRRVTSFLEEYNDYMLPILTIHEAYPGHYVQLEYSNRHPSLIRKILYSGVFAEGWAVYTEQMMLDEGFGDSDLALRLHQLKWYLRAVGNAILDHKMHCSNMTDEEALHLLVQRAFQSEGEAIGKIQRAKQSSCQLSTYFVGRMAFYRLRQQTQRKMGNLFALGRYHEQVLGHGTLPVKYLPELILGKTE